MKKEKLFTDAKIERMARKACRALRFAAAMTSCLPDELGCSLAEEFSESAIESAAEALAILAKIKCSLRRERTYAALEKSIRSLTPTELEALRSIRDGSDVFSPALARTLRELQRLHPDWFSLVTTGETADGAKPYFGAILTGAGISIVDYANGGAK